VSPVAPRAAQTAPLSRSSRVEPQAEKPLRHYLSVADLSSDALLTLLDRALELKRFPDPELKPLAGISAALVFQKPSLRTRVSFEVAMFELGGHAVYLSPAEIQLGQREGVVDAARVLSRYIDVIIARVFLHADVAGLAADATVPVINALSDREHPCQILADLLTLYERHGTLRGVRLAYVGDGNNVAHSLALAAPGLGIDLRFACPDGYEPDPVIMEQAQAGQPTGAIELFRDPREAVQGADAVYTDAWYSMGQESEADMRAPVFGRYQINAQLMSYAAPNAIAMHCLPAHRGQEITDEVLDGSSSAVYDQAENRLHAQKALLLRLLGQD
jgi:ornithine carbamoyltransferase